MKIHIVERDVIEELRPVADAHYARAVLYEAALAVLIRVGGEAAVSVLCRIAYGLPVGGEGDIGHRLDAIGLKIGQLARAVIVDVQLGGGGENYDIAVKRQKRALHARGIDLQYPVLIHAVEARARPRDTDLAVAGEEGIHAPRDHILQHRVVDDEARRALLVRVVVSDAVLICGELRSLGRDQRENYPGNERQSRKYAEHREYYLPCFAHKKRSFS